CVGPGNLTSWKDDLLRDLFQRTRVFLERGPDLLSADRAKLAKRRKQQLVRKLALSPEEPRVAAVLGGLPDRYFSESSLHEIARHIEVLLGRHGPCALEVVPQPGKPHVELVVVADDVPGLLAKITGVLFANKLDIMDAAIFSREPFGSATKGEALDIFRVRPT